MGAYLIASLPQRARNAAIMRDATSAQVQRAVELEQSITRMRPQRWYDSALAIGLFATPLCQWLGYQYWGSTSALVLPLAAFLIGYIGINGFDPYIIPHSAMPFRKNMLIIGVCGVALASLASAPSLPGIVATRVALSDLIGLLAALTISSAIRSTKVQPARK